MAVKINQMIMNVLFFGIKMDYGSRLNMSYLEGKYDTIFSWIIAMNVLALVAMLILLLF